MEGTKQPFLPENKLKVEDEGNFNLKWLVSTVLAIWPWLLGSIIISLIIGNLVLRYSTPIFRSSGELLIIDSKKGSSTSGDDIAQMLKLDNKINIDNEIEILRSRATIAKVVKELHLNVDYSVAGRFKTTHLYNNRPFTFIIADSIDDYYDCKINILGQNDYQVVETNGKTIPGKWGDTITVGLGRVVLVKTAFFTPDRLQYSIDINPVSDVATSYMYQIDISPPSKSASYITISMQDAIPEKSVDFINTLMKIYMDANIDNRNRISNSTLEFINKRIEIVSHELSGVENGIVSFKQRNNIADMSVQSQELVKRSAETVEKLVEEEAELEEIADVSNYFEKTDDKEDKQIILPASLLDNEGLSDMLNKFNALHSEIETNLISHTRNNPITKTLIAQKNEIKQNIVSSLVSSKQATQLKVDKIKAELAAINKQIAEVPGVERVYLDSARMKTIKQDMYIFLLQKREETAIQKAATVADASVIDPAITNGQVLPNKPRILMLSLLIGTIIPFGIIILRRGLNIKIISKADISRLTSIPIIGEIGNNIDGENVAIKKNSRTIISEQFRALRTNLQYLLTDKNDKVLMITSSMSGEGKSFIAVNLSITLAMSGKKVILMELDLRKPKISKTLGLENTNGFSNYAIGKTDYKDIIIPSGIDPNLFILPSGAIPPNPAELILLPRTEELFHHLREQFDYIIVDTSPVGLVTDAQLINRYADTTLYIIRQGHTFKQQLNIPNELYYSGKIPRLSFIVNDVLANRGFAYGYGYEEGYGYGYGYGYGHGYGYGYGYGSYGSGYYGEDKKKGIGRFFKRKPKEK